MKILLISSSPHKEKSQTFLLAKEVLQGISDQGAKFEVIHLSDLHLNFCQHCEACHKDDMRCVIADDAARVIDKMLAAGGGQ